MAFGTADTVLISDYFGVETGKKVNKIEKAGCPKFLWKAKGRYSFDEAILRFRPFGVIIHSASGSNFFHDFLNIKIKYNLKIKNPALRTSRHPVCREGLMVTRRVWI